MKKLAVLLLMGAVIVAFSASDAMADRYFGGTYTYTNGPTGEWPWFGDAGNGPHAYTAESGNAMADGTVKVRPTNQAFDANSAQVQFDDPADSTGPGTTEAWWGALSNTDRYPLVTLDLGQEVAIDAIVTVHNMRHASSIGIRGYSIDASHDGVTWQEILKDGQPWADQTQQAASPLGEKYNDLFVRPAFRPIGLFLNPATGVYDLNSVTYRYLKFQIGRPGGEGGVGEFWDSTVVSEIIIMDTTLRGDTNHDGDVDLVDLGALAGNYGKTSGATWEQGDFNGDGDVDLVDLGDLAGNYGIGVPAAPGAPLNFAADAASVGLPEPATMMLLGFGAFGVIRRRR